MRMNAPLRPALLAALLALALAPAAQAQFKVVNPDGTVTYTDRPPPAASAVPLASRPAATAATANLPPELAGPASKYPATLYTSLDCQPCEAARQMLRARGVPHVEKLVVTMEEGQALKRIAGGTEVPSLTLGSDALRGYSPDKWNAYLDAAGYPRTSKLPRGYAFAAAEPLLPPRPPATAQAPAAPRADTPSPVPPASPDNPAGIRF
jgi:glutaredoxin